jgi:flagellar motility protein MotE (MotC chaperone)
MDINTENTIIREYKKGKSSLQISDIVGLSKTTILKVLRKNNLIRKRDRCQKLTYFREGDYYVIHRICPTCGDKTPTKSKDKTVTCRNHLKKIHNNLDCKKCSLLKQIGSGNPFYGKKHTKKTKSQISKSRTGKATGEHNAMANLKHRFTATERLLEKWKSGEMEHARKIMSETMKKTIRDGKLKSVIKSMAEKKIQEIIENLNFEVISSYRVDTKICDLYIPELNLIVEYNGDYWHCNPKKYDKDYFNQKKSMFAWELWEYDRLKLDLIRKKGYNIEVIWEFDFKSNKTIIEEIIFKYERQKNNSTPGRS